jgi:hypothetical protein
MTIHQTNSVNLECTEPAPVGNKFCRLRKP